MKHRVYDSSGKRICIRMCVSCRENKPKSELIRIVKSPDGVVAIDEKSALAGRGPMYASRSVLKRAEKQGIERG